MSGFVWRDAAAASRHFRSETPTGTRGMRMPPQDTKFASDRKNVMQLELRGLVPAPGLLYHASAELFRDELQRFCAFGTSTFVTGLRTNSGEMISVFANEFWTSKQRAASSLHEVSYRACFKPQLPRFFIERLTRPGDLVYDPFMGRGTTLLEAALLERRSAGCDINPLSSILLRPRLVAPTLEEIDRRLDEIQWDYEKPLPGDLLVFYHPATLRQICALREALRHSRSSVDQWIRMVATNRLTGHSKGFFSVYTLPPNQAVSIRSQKRTTEPSTGGTECSRAYPPQEPIALIGALDWRAERIVHVGTQIDPDYRFVR